MKLDKNRIMDVLFYLCLLSLLVWAYMKAAGYFNTPLILQMFPYLGAVFAAGMFYQRFVQLGSDVRVLKNDMSHVKAKIGVVDNDIGHLRSDVEVLKGAMIS